VYNAISVKHQIPLGGEDVRKYSGGPRLSRATGNEKFELISSGETMVEHPDVGEVVWCDDEGVTCRRWNWRQSRRTALTDETTSGVCFFDALEPVSDDALAAAAEELVSAVKSFSPDVRVMSRVIGMSEKL
jgi:DNA/RNA-binding domain of Phe-tRNA-synthetase-like protein